MLETMMRSITSRYFFEFCHTFTYCFEYCCTFSTVSRRVTSIFYITTFWLTMMCATYFLCPEDDRRYCMEITQFVVFGYTIYGIGKWLFVFVALLLGRLLMMINNGKRMTNGNRI